jgi:GNAT superfamily N-acetyltransferase
MLMSPRRHEGHKGKIHLHALRAFVVRCGDHRIPPAFAGIGPYDNIAATQRRRPEKIMNAAQPPLLVVEIEPASEKIRLLEERLYAFNVEATGIADGQSFGLFLRGADGTVIGGAYGWSWGDTCHLRYLFVPPELRGQGHGTQLMRSVEQQALSRFCRQIVLETHDFQAPEFYRRFGFVVTGMVEGYPRGHRFFTMVKKLPEPAPARY